MAQKNLELPKSRVWIDIDLAVLRSNLHSITKKVFPSKVMPVLKANAYGLGVLPIAQALKTENVHSFGVAELNEALTIIHLGVPVQILGGLLKDEISEVVKNNIIAPIADNESALSLNEEATKQRKKVECHFLIDTGMGRFGFFPNNAEESIRKIMKLKGLRCTGIYTHFAQAYNDVEFSKSQLRRFLKLLQSLRRSGLNFKWIHCANSDGINNVRESYVSPFNLVRNGLNLYGIFDLEGNKTLNLKSAISLRTRLVAIRKLPKESTLGYGRTYTLTKPTLVGTIAIGYADGLPMAMSNVGCVKLRGKTCRILGRISMDYTTISLDSVPEAKEGDVVDCWDGRSDVCYWAKVKGTIPYEILCSLGTRARRRHLN